MTAMCQSTSRCVFEQECMQERACKRVCACAQAVCNRVCNRACKRQVCVHLQPLFSFGHDSDPIVGNPSDHLTACSSCWLAVLDPPHRKVGIPYDRMRMTLNL